MQNTKIKWTFPGRYEKFLGYSGRRMSDYLGRTSHLDVLDAGCSNGIEAARLAVEYPAHSFTGLDFSKELIMRAASGKWRLGVDLYFFHEKFYYESLRHAFKLIDLPSREVNGVDHDQMLELRGEPSNLNYLVADYEHLPFASKSFDVILAFNCGFKPKEDGCPTRAMGEFSRVLRKGGLILSNSWGDQLELRI